MYTKERLAALDRAIDSRADWLCRLSDAIWDRPELAFQEYFAAEQLAGALEQEGFAVERGIAGMPTAFLGRFGAGKPVIGILGEYDALAGLSQTADCTVRTPLTPGGNGHGCGHNLLGVGSLAAVLGVKDYLQETGAPGTVLYFGCPAEEGGSGKAFLVRSGAFRDVDCVLAWHPCSYHSAALSTSLANRQLLYEFTGVSAHASSHPERGRSALDALTLMNTGVQFLREHVPSSTRIHYAVLDTGGTSPNVVQASASAAYLIRTPSVDDLPALVERLNKVARGAAMMTETEVTITLQKGCANVIPNRVLSRLLGDKLRELPAPRYTPEELAYGARMAAVNPEAGRRKIQQFRNASPAFAAFVEAHGEEPILNYTLPELPGVMQKDSSTDVGDVSWVCPTAELLVCTMAVGTGGHTWQRTAQGKSAIAHKGMLYAGKLLAAAALDLLTTPELVEDARREWRQQLGGRVYAPLPEDVQPNGRKTET